MADDNLKGIKRFGARYGRTLKLKFAKVESQQRKKHKCPYCSSAAVRRVSLGVWNCKKCDATFTGKAYTIAKKKTQKEQKEEVFEDVQQQKQEDPDDIQGEKYQDPKDPNEEKSEYHDYDQHIEAQKD